MITRMTQRARLVLALVTASVLLAGSAAGATASPAAAGPVQEVITITRTSPTGLAALALIGTVQASQIPGFIATVDRTSAGAEVGTFADFNGASGINRYGHGGSSSLCNAPIVCAVNLDTDTVTFSMTETDSGSPTGSGWAGMTRYLVLRGSKINLQVAAIGFTVKRHTSATFARVTRDQADADGVAVSSIGAEAFKAAQLPGGKAGSFAVLQLPCDGQGAGAVTFAATNDPLPALAHCEPAAKDDRVVVGVGSVSTYGGRPGLFSRSAGTSTQWQVSGLVAGVSGSLTRLFVLNY